MAAVRQHGWRAIPAVRSGYGADTLLDRYRSTDSSRLVRTAELRARLHDRCRRTCNSFPETDGTKRSFCCVIVRLRQTVITVITEGVPLIQDIAERFAQSGFFDNVPFFSTIHSCSDVSNALLRCCLAARRSDSGKPRISSSMAYSSLMRFRASSAVVLLLLMYTSWIFAGHGPSTQLLSVHHLHVRH